MGNVQNNSNIIIQKVVGNSVVNLGNRLFNGYVYNLSLTVGLNGEPSRLILNVALNKTLTTTAAANQNLRKENLKKQIKLIDEDFNISLDDVGINNNYIISIKGENDLEGYQLSNFKIISFSINKKDNEKILTLTLVDKSIVLDKIFVGLLGHHIALDSRSKGVATVDSLKIYCPAINYEKPQTKEVKSFQQNLHFVGSKLAQELSLDDIALVQSSEENDPEKFNYITIQSKRGTSTSIQNGYGAIILLGEEEFRDSPCAASEITYSFETLLAAMKKLGIKISPTKLGESDSLKDKSKGKIKKNFSGTLKNVLNQWCDEYSYSYTVDFAEVDNIEIKGIDLSSDISNETLLKTKLSLETLEKRSLNFVIKSQDFDCDLSQKKIKLYSSYYFKEAQDKASSFKQPLRNVSFNNMNLLDLFPQWFGRFSGGSWIQNDFCGAARTYNQVVTSAVLGVYSQNLRKIYNYSIGAFRALGFITLDSFSKRDYDKYSSAAISTILEAEKAVESSSISDFDKLSYDAYLGYRSLLLETQIEKIESYIASFIGKHYATDPINVNDGFSFNNNSVHEYQITTSPPTEKYYNNTFYNLKIFQEANYLQNELASLFNGGTNEYFEASRKISEQHQAIDIACNSTINNLNFLNANLNKNLIFYSERSGAAYGTYAEIMHEIKILKYYALGEYRESDLTEYYAPFFKEFDPASILALRALVPIENLSDRISHLELGVLICRKNNVFIINEADGGFTNSVEFLTQIQNYCNSIQGIILRSNVKNIKNAKNDCDKTFFYQVCVFGTEQDKIVIDNNASTQAALGPSAVGCLGVRISRKLPNEKDMLATIYSQLNPAINDAKALLESVVVYHYSFGKQKYTELTDSRINENIVLPSQGSYPIQLISQTDAEIFSPFRQYVNGGLENSSNISKILENDGFSISVSSQNLTPNVRGLFGEESSAALVSSNVSDDFNLDPILVDYLGYEKGNNPIYEFTTFSKFHEVLNNYYDEKNISIKGSSISYSADIFCSSISSELKKILSVKNGLNNLSISFGEGGLNIKCGFSSKPAASPSMETLIYKNKPNIKFQNTNFLT